MMLSTQGRGHRGGGVVWEIPSTVDMAPCDLVYRSLDDAPPVLVGPRLEQVLRIEATSVAVLDVEFRHCARLRALPSASAFAASISWPRNIATFRSA